MVETNKQNFETSCFSLFVSATGYARIEVPTQIFKNTNYQLKINRSRGIVYSITRNGQYTFLKRIIEYLEILEWVRYRNFAPHYSTGSVPVVCVPLARILRLWKLLLFEKIFACFYATENGI